MSGAAAVGSSVSAPPPSDGSGSDPPPSLASLPKAGGGVVTGPSPPWPQAAAPSASTAAASAGKLRPGRSDLPSWGNRRGLVRGCLVLRPSALLSPRRLRRTGPDLTRLRRPRRCPRLGAASSPGRRHHGHRLQRAVRALRQPVRARFVVA